MAGHRISWHAMGGAVVCHGMRCTMATPAAIATAHHGNLTACHGSSHGTPMSTAPRLGLVLGLGYGFHDMPWTSVGGSVEDAVEDAVEGFAAGGATACCEKGL